MPNALFLGGVLAFIFLWRKNLVAPAAARVVLRVLAVLD